MISRSTGTDDRREGDPAPSPIPLAGGSLGLLGDATLLAEAIFQSVREPLIVLDAELRVCFANRAFYRCFLVTPEETVGRFVYRIGAGQWDIPALRRLLGQIIPRDSYFDDFEVEHNFPGLGHRVMLLNARRINDEDGRPAVILLAIEDSTDRRNAERAMATATAELKRSNRELEEFASVASHDLQEPLRKILAFGDRLDAACGPVLGDRGRDYLERIQNAAVRMQLLIDGLLDFARVTTRGQPFRPVDLNQVAREVAGDLEAQLTRTGGRLVVDALPTVEGDPMQLRQLLQNLLSNALKFRRPDESPIVHLRGDVPTTIGQGDPAPGGPWCRIEVEDNGIGFDETYMGRIFTPFGRLHGRSEYEGTGIGLALCRRIAERHGGTIAATSIPGRGSTFAVTLPLQRSDRRSGDE